MQEEDDFQEECDRPDPVGMPGTATARECSICLSSWTATGQHRIACLKCGHLFGRQCIDRWIKLHGSCPECKRTAKMADVRVLYTANFAVADTAERDSAQELLRREKRARMRLEYENAALKATVERLGRELEKKSRKEEAYRLDRVIEIDQGRSFAVRNFDADGVLATCRGSRGDYGIRRISAVDLNHSSFIACGSKSLRDVRFSKSGELVLCGGLSKELQMMSLKSETIVLQYPVKHAIWSCCWGGEEDEIYAFCGDEAGNVHLFDIRNTKDVLRSFPCEWKGNGHRGIHSLQLIDSEKIAVGSLDHSQILSYTNEKDELIEIPNSLCSSISIDRQNSSILCVLRNPDPISENNHFVYKLDENGLASSEYGFKTTDKCRAVLARSSLAGSLVCSAEEQSKQAIIYNSGVSLFRSDAHPSHILDTGICEDGKLFLTASASQIHVYSSCDPEN